MSELLNWLILVAVVVVLCLSAAGAGWLVGGRRGALRLAAAAVGFFGVYLTAAILASLGILPPSGNFERAMNLNRLVLLLGSGGALVGFLVADRALGRPRDRG
jgi:hypothetical protein